MFKESIQKKNIEEQNLIDKRYIGSFLINYLDINNTQKVKNELLETLSSLLDLNESERVRIGLENIKSNQLFEAKESKEKNITSLFMNYLKDN